MDMKNYLNRQRNLKLSGIARAMWPGSVSPEVLLSFKLSGKRPWTNEDNLKAEAAVRKIHNDCLAELNSNY